MVSFAWMFPEFLNKAGLMGVYSSREYSYLVFLYLEIGMIISTVISATRSWRTITLRRRKLGLKDLIRVQTDFLASIKDEDLRDKFSEIVSDTAALRENIIGGQFETATGWGWSIIGRILDKLSPVSTNAQDKAEKVNLLTEKLKKCYKVRTKTVHAGYKPNFDEACAFLELIREVLTELTSRNQKIL